MEGLAAGELMGRAALAVADEAASWLRDLAPDAGVLLLVGPGNNGGDALLAGLALADRGYRVTACGVEAICSAAPRAIDAALAWARWQPRPILPLSAIPAAPVVPRCLLVIDGLFGIGLDRPLGPPFPALFAALQELRGCGCPILAIDSPSGLDADRGNLPIPPRALTSEGDAPGLLEVDATITMIGDKPGLHTGLGRQAAGRVIVAPLTPPSHPGPSHPGPSHSEPLNQSLSPLNQGDPTVRNQPPTAALVAPAPAPATASASAPASASALATATAVATALGPADGHLIDAEAARAWWQPRAVDSHKGSHGDLLIVGGREGMQGAARLAARGALAAGAGKVSIAVAARPGQRGGLDARDSKAPAANAGANAVVSAAANAAADPQRPEIMAWAWRHDGLERFDVIAAGCGLGFEDEAGEWLEAALATPASLVLDADGLTWLARSPRLVSLARRRRPGTTIVTPHPLEAARLLVTDAAGIQADRLGAAIRLADRLAATVVLKGAGTVVADPTGNWAINTSGGPILATAGTGDVLAGIIAALAATLPASRAACLGVWLHGAAGDLEAGRRGDTGMPAARLTGNLAEVLVGLHAGLQ